MSVTALGAPGIVFDAYEQPFALRGVRRDVAAFAGVAPRGPARVPIGELARDADLTRYLRDFGRQRSVAVAVDSWDAYRTVFGGFEGAGRLPYAVSAFFAQGGRRAFVVRIVHGYADAALDDAGRSAGWFGRRPPGSPMQATRTPAAPLMSTAGGLISVTARNEGVWGDRVRADLAWVTRPVPLIAATVEVLTVPDAEWLPVGSLLRLRLADGRRVLRFVDDSARLLRADRGGAYRLVTLAKAVDEPPVLVEVATATLMVIDDDPTLRRTEQLAGLGVRADHPRWLGRVLATDSTLLWPDASWAADGCDLTDPDLPAMGLFGADPADAARLDLVGQVEHLLGGLDRSAEITGDDFFDASWVPGDERPGNGIHCLGETDEVGLLLAPDLYSPSPLAQPEAPVDEPSLAGAGFTPCVEPVIIEPQPPLVLDLSGLRLDPTVPADLARIAALQGKLVDIAEHRRDLIALLDVPPGLGLPRTLAWRSGFDTAYAACYHPWLDVARPDDDRDALVSVNPSAFAAGIIAARELRDGVHVGPANVIAAGAVRASERVGPADHDRLHPEGINVLRTERDGLRLTAARTLNRTVELRQLNVVRLLTVIRMSLERQLSWLVFEPNGEQTWRSVRRVVGDYLEGLHRTGALAGATPAQSYFVRCGRDTMTAADLDGGRLIAEIGVAPSVPIEYLLLRLSVTAEVSVSVERTS